MSGVPLAGVVAKFANVSALSQGLIVRSASARPANRGIEHAESEHMNAPAHTPAISRRKPVKGERVCMEIYTNS